MAEKRLISDGEARRRIIAFATGLHSEVLPVDTVMMLLSQVPTVDAVEVVRCKDCKHRTKNRMCPMISGCPDLVGVDDDFFCKYGKRRTEDA